MTPLRKKKSKLCTSTSPGTVIDSTCVCMFRRSRSIGAPVANPSLSPDEINCPGLFCLFLTSFVSKTAKINSSK